MNKNEIDAIKSMIEKYVESRPKLTILIMGPGKDNKDDYAQKCYKKRCQIKDFLTKNGHRASLPETRYEEAKRNGVEVLNITEFERYLIDQSNQVIILYVPNCPGVDHEVSVFSISPECVRKLYFLYGSDCRYTQTFFKDKIDFIEGGNGKVEQFCKNEVEECSLLTRVGQRIEQVARFHSMSPYKKYEGVE